MLKLRTVFTKQATSTRRSTVLSLPLQLGFPATLLSPSQLQQRIRRGEGGEGEVTGCIELFHTRRWKGAVAAVGVVLVVRVCVMFGFLNGKKAYSEASLSLPPPPLFFLFIWF
jgi:hypothetical protein